MLFNPSRQRLRRVFNRGPLHRDLAGCRRGQLQYDGRTIRGKGQGGRRVSHGTGDQTWIGPLSLLLSGVDQGRSGGTAGHPGQVNLAIGLQCEGWRRLAHVGRKRGRGDRLVGPV